MLTVLLGILMVSIGSHYRVGWRTHTQRIMIGLSTASIAQLAVQIVWQIVAKTAKPHSMAEYQHVVDLREKLFNANSVVYLAVVIWWIACLWIDEPRKADPAEILVPVGPSDPLLEDAAKAEPLEDTQGERAN